MVLFNYSTRELTAKIVYYGPGLCGKTTNLQYIHGTLPETVKGKMLSLATKTDRTLFFDFLPIDLGQIRGMKTRVQLYTVPGQVFYNETRKLVLKGADGIVFVADSQAAMLGANVESFRNLEENLKAHGMKLSEMPHVIQFNKRDLPKLSGIEELNSAINRYNAPFYEAVATTGIGVQDSLKAITKLVLLQLTKKYDPKATPAEPRPAPAPAAAPAVAPAAQTMQIPIASVMPQQSTGIPLSQQAQSAPQPDALMRDLPPAAAEPAPPAFAEQEIDQLVDEVQETEDTAEEPVIELAAAPEVEDAAPAIEEPAANPEFEIDHQVDPEWGAAGSASPEPVAEPASEQNDLWQLGSSEDEVETPPTVPPGDGLGLAASPRLTEVVADTELFDDPSLDVTHMAAGEEREIVIPVEIQNGPSAGRFKLSVKLRLDPVD